MDVTNTISIDTTIAMQIFATRLLTIADVYVHHMGLPPREAGASTAEARVKDFSLTWAEARRTSGDSDEAQLAITFTFSAGSDIEGGALLTLAMIFNSIKGALDRQPIRDAATTHLVVGQIGAMSIVDNAEAGAQEDLHANLAAACTYRARVTRTSGTVISTLPPG